MILHPAVIALLTGSLLVGLMVAYAAFWGWRIIDGWDLQSGSERQIALEKKTYLVSTLMTYAFGFQVLSFFLFVYVADDLHRLFVGAMCAAGTLNVNEYGYPAATDSRRALAATGARWAGLLVTWYMERKDSTDVRPVPGSYTSTRPVHECSSTSSRAASNVPSSAGEKRRVASVKYMSPSVAITTASA